MRILPRVPHWLRRTSILAASLLALPATSLVAQNAPPPESAIEPTLADTQGGQQGLRSEASDESATYAPRRDPYNSSPYIPSDLEGLQGIRTLPPGAFTSEDQPPGVPYSSILTPTGADVHDIGGLAGINGLPVRTSYSNPVNFGNAEGGFGLSSGNLNFTDPFLRTGSEPEDADLKVGPLYVKFHSLEGLTLYDDNYTRVAQGRRSELLVLLSLNLSIIAQLSDNLQFAVSGSIQYLPLQNQVGIISNAYGNLGLLLSLAPLFAAQLVEDVDIGGWPVRFADDFRVQNGNYGQSLRDNFNLFQGDYLQQDQNGDYAFHSSNTHPNGSVTQGNQNYNASIIYFTNTISAYTDQLLPTDTLLTLLLRHQDLWYNQSNAGLPSSSDVFQASLISERENLRFKPYASYEASRTNNSAITQVARIGIAGPIDDQVFVRADAGYYFDAFGHSSEVYQFTLNHTAGEYTSEMLTLSRDLSAFDQDQLTSEYYRLDQILGPTVNGSIFADHTNVVDLQDNGAANRSEYYAGAELRWYIGPKTTLQLAAIGAEQKFSNGVRTDVFTGRAILNRTITDTFTMELLYQYQRAQSHGSGLNYFENLVYLRLVKYFY